MQEVTSNEAGNRIKTRGYCIIKSACLHIDLIFTLRFLVFPGLEKNQDLQNEKEQVEQTKQEMQDTVFLSDDLAITTIDYLRNPTSEIPVSLDGFAAMIMMSGSAVLSIDTETYEVRPNMLVFFRPGSIIRTLRPQTLFAGDRTRRGRNPAVFPAYQDRDPER